VHARQPHEAIVQSCNTYFYALGEALQNAPGKTGIDRLAKNRA
jgi:cell division protein FtsI/penicillin-binding protein 2